MRFRIVGILTACAVPAAIMTAPTAHAQEIQVSPDTSRPAQPAPASNFTGEVMVTTLLSANEYSANGGGEVAFSPGARTNWHTHPTQQTLIVTEGTGWVAQWGGLKQEMNTGDVVTIPPGIKHWHGATEVEAMTHIAMADDVDGLRVTWMEPVAAEQYLG
jgi:quercetin dioxygenase-like cupin family protein